MSLCGVGKSDSIGAGTPLTTRAARSATLQAEDHPNRRHPYQPTNKASLTIRFWRAVDESTSVYPTGQRAEARKQRQARTSTGVTRTRLTTKSLSDYPVSVGNKGVLRTVGSKSTFAYFSLTRKVGRRRQNTKRGPSGTDRKKISLVGYRQKRPRPSSEGQTKPPALFKGPGAPRCFLLGRTGGSLHFLSKNGVYITMWKTMWKLWKTLISLVFAGAYPRRFPHVSRTFPEVVRFFVRFPW